MAKINISWRFILVSWLDNSIARNNIDFDLIDTLVLVDVCDIREAFIDILESLFQVQRGESLYISGLDFAGDVARKDQGGKPLDAISLRIAKQHLRGVLLRNYADLVTQIREREKVAAN